MRPSAGILLIFSAALSLAPLAAAAGAPPVRAVAAPARNLFFIGQDLDSIRDYLRSGCCARPDGATAYIALYNTLSAERGFGGTGIDAAGNPADLEFSWGAGHVSAYKTATESGAPCLAIGLFIAENSEPGALAGLLAGQFDPQIAQLARLFRLVNKRVLLRIGYEFDGPWNAGTRNPAVYRNAYRHIVDTLRGLGVTNAEYVWQASASPLADVIDKSHKDIRDWYPGDDYVDWMALSWFLNPEARPTLAADFQPRTPGTLADQLLAFARARGKPVMIAESAPQGIDLARGFSANISPLWDGPAGNGRTALSNAQIWDRYYGPLFRLLDDNADLIHAFAYINCQWDAQPMWGPPYDSGFWGDSRLQSNPAIESRFRAALARWRGRGRGRAS